MSHTNYAAQGMSWLYETQKQNNPIYLIRERSVAASIYTGVIWRSCLGAAMRREEQHWSLGKSYGEGVEHCWGWDEFLGKGQS